MASRRIEEKWIAAFARVLELSQLKRGESVALLSETQSRAVNVELAELAALRLGGRAFHLVVPTRGQAIILERVTPSAPPEKSIVAAR